MNRIQIAVLLIILGSGPVADALAAERVPKLSLYVTPFDQPERLPMSTALYEIGTRVQNGLVLFGVEIREKGGAEPMVDLKVSEGVTLDEALQDLLRQLPEYTLEVVLKHVINIYPQGAKDDAKDPLNMRVKRFDFVNRQISEFMNYPGGCIPELAKRLVQRTEGPPYPVEFSEEWATSPYEPKTTLHLRNVTVREVLNAASKATIAYPFKAPPLGWSSLFHPDPAWAVGGTYQWRAFWCASMSWKKPSKPSSGGTHVVSMPN